jgi:hypothetical protein
MASRYISAGCAMLYGLLFGVSFFGWGIWEWHHGLYHDSLLRLLKALIAMYGAATIFIGMSRWHLVAVMVMIILLQFKDTTFWLGCLPSRTCSYGWEHWSLIAAVFLPIVTLFAGLMGEGGWSRSVGFVRRWPYHKSS